MNDLYEIIGTLLAMFLLWLLGSFMPKVKAWLEACTSKTTYDRLMTLVTSFARAAEQLYHDQDPAGTLRKKFVQEQLTLLGIEITEAVLNLIEGAVWEINTENKKALVRTKEIVSGGVCNGNG